MRRRLLDWFDDHQRTLPWRSDPTLYKVWVSEIMLQQTQVATVLGYFDRFLEAFPNIEKLAVAPEQQLLSLWEGLGYYRRAKLMQRAAQVIVEKHRGQFPSRYEDVLALPGIGRYTAGAILSIAENQRLPIVEGNTVRVYSRWVALTEPIKSPAAVATLWDVAEAMLPSRNRTKRAGKTGGAPHRGAGTFNQAAMELGALVCKPKPDCDRCPVRKGCAAHEFSLQQSIPGKVSTTVYEDRREFAFVISRQNDRRQTEYLVHHRGPTMRWAGMWDFPRATEADHVDIETAVEEVAKMIAMPIQPGIRLRTIKHGVTKYRIELHVHRASLGEDRTPSRSESGHQTRGDAATRWVSAADLQQLAMPVTGRKIATWLAKNAQTELF